MRGGRSRVVTLLLSPAELTGKEVGVASTSIPWTVDNKYYSAELQLVVCEGVEVVRGGSWEGAVLLCDFSKVRTRKGGAQIEDIVQECHIDQQ